MSNVNIYLKIKFAKYGQLIGAAIADDHGGEILVDSIRWGEENSAAIGGKGGSVTLRNFEFTKKMCPASAQLVQACAGSDPVVEAVITCRSTNHKENVDFLTWTLADGIISLYEVEAPSKDAGGIPNEVIRIRFRTVSMVFKPRDKEGKLKGAMTARVDVGANVSSS